MAEGLLWALAGELCEGVSARTKPSTVNPLAIAAMDERGIDIRAHRAKYLDEFRTQLFDYVISVCDSAAESCPVFPGPAQHIHWSFPDPAAAPGNEADRWRIFREIRDAIEVRRRVWPTTVTVS